jgi:mono/diheme cytochrome c family protein
MTGYLGGELVFGHNHLFKGVLADRGPEPEAPSLGAVTNSGQAAQTEETTHSARDAIDFSNDVLPILRQHCLRCHGGDKVRGKLSLKTKSSAMRGGVSGPSIVPGQGESSSLYTLLVETKPSLRMPPPKEKQLSQQQIQVIKAWIDQGAIWPDNCELR